MSPAGWFALVALAAMPACESKPAVDPGARAAACASARDIGARAHTRWTEAGKASPPEDAPLSAIAEHASALAKTAGEISGQFAPRSGLPAQPDLAESAEGARMLGDLAARRLETLAATLRALDTKLPSLTQLESAANDATDKLGRAEDLGCHDAKKPGCQAVLARMAELDHAAIPSGFAGAAQLSRTRGDTLAGLAQAITALPPAPAKQKPRDDAAKAADAAASALRALAAALTDAAPLQERLAKERQDAQEAVLRLSAELDAASKVCAPPPASAKAPPPAGTR